MIAETRVWNPPFPPLREEWSMSIFDRLIRRGEDGAELPRWKDVSLALAGSAESYKQQHPDEAAAIDAFLAALGNDGRRRYPKVRGTEETPAPQNALARFYLSEDRMKAYLCVFPPLSGGAEMTLEALRKDLHYEGISFGLLEDQMRSYAGQKRYLEILPIAQGRPPRDGEDGGLEELFEQKEEARLEVPSGTVIDFSAGKLMPSVRAGDAVCHIRPPVPGEDGVDVTGQVIPCRQSETIEIPAGENTRLEPDGLTLCAAIDGILYFKDGCFCVRPQKIVAVDLDGPAGTCSIQGDLFIRGSVDGGAVVEATGDVIIAGEVRDGQVISTGGTIRVQQGVHGVAGKTVLKAARQLQAAVIETARAEAGGDVISEVIMDSEVSSGGSVFVTGGRGLILGGQVQAAREVRCQQIGNITGKRSRITVGYSPATAAERDRIAAALAETSDTLDKLWKNIGDLRRAGKLPPEKQDLLNRLVEQRALYEEQKDKLKTEQKELREKMRAASTGQITCRDLYPTTEIQLGAYSTEIAAQETNCRIRVHGEGLVLR